MEGESSRRAPAWSFCAMAGAAIAALCSLSAQAAQTVGRAAPATGAPLTGAEIRAVEHKLAEMGFWTEPADGPWGESSRQALVAFQKTAWRQPTGRLTRAEYHEVLRGFAPAPRETGETHVEVDLARQILFLVDAGGKVSHILPISSGSGKAFRAPGWQATADTPCGHFTVFAKLYGWQHSPLGEMHNPMFIVGGIAIHGSASVPARPVSHGCIRIPMFASRTLTKIVPRDTPVVVYGCKDEEPPAASAVAATVAAPTH